MGYIYLGSLGLTTEERARLARELAAREEAARVAAAAPQLPAIRGVTFSIFSKLKRQMEETAARLKRISEERAEAERKAAAEAIARAEAVIVPLRPAVVPPGVTIVPPRPILIKPPSVYVPATRTEVRAVEPLIISRPPSIKDFVLPRVTDVHMPSGATVRSTEVSVVAGADPTSASITGAGAPMTGQTVSLRESSPIVPLVASQRGITLLDEQPITVEALPVVPVKEAGISPIVLLLIAGIALPMLLMGKKKR